MFYGNFASVQEVARPRVLCQDIKLRNAIKASRFKRIAFKSLAAYYFAHSHVAYIVHSKIFRSFATLYR